MGPMYLSLVLTAATPTPPPGGPPTFVDFYGDTATTIIWRTNAGQVIDTEGDLRPDVEFYSEGGMVRRYVRDNGSTAFVINNADTTGHDTLLRVDMIASGEMALLPDVLAQYQTGGLNNYYLPHTAPGITGVPGYKRVVQENIYEEIDLIHYSGSSGDKMALVIWPGGNPEDVLLQFNGQDSLGIDPLLEDLIIYLRGKEIRIPEAVAYQIDLNENVIPLAWDADWVEAGSDQYATVSFDAYDPGLPVVLLFGRPPSGGPIQTPGVCWSSYLGGPGEEKIAASDIDQYGNYYVTGYTYSDELDFPIQTGAVLTTGSPSVFLTRFDAVDSLWWSSWIGGSVGNQYATSVAVSTDADPRVYIGGMTSTSDYYTFDPTTGAYYDDSGGGNCGFVARFDTLGFLHWSTYFGVGGVYVRNMDIDNSGRLVIVGESDGDLPTNQVPLPPNAEQWSYSGGSTDAFIALFTLNDEVLWSTFVGGSGDEFGRSVRTGGQGRIVMAGFTTSTTMDTQDGGSNAWDQGMSAGSQDVYLIEFNANGDQQWGTFWGGSGADELGEQGLAIDPATGDVTLVGRTSSSDLPLEAGLNWADSTFLPLFYNGFIVQFDGFDRSMKWATYVSGNKATRLIAVEHGSDGHMFVGGSVAPGICHTQPVSGLYWTDDVLGDGDGYLLSFTADKVFEWGTIFGGDDTLSYGDIIWTLALKNGEKLYAAGTTFAANDPGQFFPLTDPATGA